MKHALSAALLASIFSLSSGCSSEPSCLPPTSCDGVCVDFTSDPQNCGGCGLVCPSWAQCQASHCVAQDLGGGAGNDSGMPDGTQDAGAQDDAGQADAGLPDPAVYPAPFPAPPQVVNLGGSVLANPKVIALFFSNDADPQVSVSGMSNFYTGVGATAYWQSLSEYGVGPLTASIVNLSESAPATVDDVDIQSWLLSEMNAGTIPLPDANTVYAINYPKGTTVTSGAGTSCQSFGGYHSSFAANNGSTTFVISYAVIPRCSSLGFFTGIDAFSTTASHELLEAATDPDPSNNPAFAVLDDDHSSWMRMLGGGELGDMCAQFEDGYYRYPDFSYVVARFWSNARAKLGHNPCVPPVPEEFYFNAAPVLADHAPVTIDSNTFNSLAVHIPVGGSATIPVELYSDAPTQDWTLEAMDWSLLFGGNPKLSFGFSSSAGHNGDTVQLTITVNSGSPSGVEYFLIRSKLGTLSHLWIGLVGN